jgi:hypothetical protein
MLWRTTVIDVDKMREFSSYLRTLTEAQLIGALSKENNAGRPEYVVLIENEIYAREITNEEVFNERCSWMD